MRRKKPAARGARLVPLVGVQGPVCMVDLTGLSYYFFLYLTPQPKGFVELTATAVPPANAATASST